MGKINERRYKKLFDEWYQEAMSQGTPEDAWRWFETNNGALFPGNKHVIEAKAAFDALHITLGSLRSEYQQGRRRAKAQQTIELIEKEATDPMSEIDRLTIAQALRLQVDTFDRVEWKLDELLAEREKIISGEIRDEAKEELLEKRHLETPRGQQELMMGHLLTELLGVIESEAAEEELLKLRRKLRKREVINETGIAVMDYIRDNDDKFQPPLKMHERVILMQSIGRLGLGFIPVNEMPKLIKASQYAIQKYNNEIT